MFQWVRYQPENAKKVYLACSKKEKKVNSVLTESMQSEKYLDTVPQ
jgi:hypothetical protein